MKRKTPNWKPRRYGPYYCSPACGGDCAYVDYLAVKKAAAALAKQLGPG